MYDAEPIEFDDIFSCTTNGQQMKQYLSDNFSDS